MSLGRGIVGVRDDVIRASFWGSPAGVGSAFYVGIG